jgi:hypothetical protein
MMGIERGFEFHLCRGAFLLSIKYFFLSTQISTCIHISIFNDLYQLMIALKFWQFLLIIILHFCKIKIQNFQKKSHYNNNKIDKETGRAELKIKYIKQEQSNNELCVCGNI